MRLVAKNALNVFSYVEVNLKKEKHRMSFVSYLSEDLQALKFLNQPLSMLYSNIMLVLF